jgi:APA family basic amino acid/polyamine antiporter
MGGDCFGLAHHRTELLRAAFRRFTQNILSVSKLLAIGGLLVAGLSWGSGSWNNFTPLFPDLMPQGGVSALGLALIPIVFTYTGWNAVAYIASEVRNPETTLPRSAMLGTMITMGVYLALNLLYLYAVPVAELKGVVQVGDVVADALFGELMGHRRLIAMSIASALNDMVLTGGWIYFARPATNYFSSRADLTLVSECWVTVVIASRLTSILILSGTFEQLRPLDCRDRGFLDCDDRCFVYFALAKPTLPRPYHVWGIRGCHSISSLPSGSC